MACSSGPDKVSLMKAAADKTKCLLFMGHDVFQEEMESMTMKIRREKGEVVSDRTAKSNSMFRLVIILSVIIFFISGISWFISYKTRYVSSHVMEINLKERFPGYFRFPEEQAAFMSLNRKSNDVASSTNHQNRSYIGHEQTISQFMEQSYHACCQSTGTFISPDYMVDWLGISRMMAVFKDPLTGKLARQFFHTETCRGKIDCMYKCKCCQSIRFVTGVYVKGSSYWASWFPIPGSCKCMNIQSKCVKETLLYL